MHYINARDGIKSIRTAELLTLWTVILTALSAFLAPILGPAVLLPLIAALVLGVISIVLQLVGVSRAARDLNIFIEARTALIAGLILSVLAGVLQRVSVVSAILELLSSLCSLYAEIKILKGIIALSEIVRRPYIAEQGKRLIPFVLGVQLGSIVLTQIQDLLPEQDRISVPVFLLSLLVLGLGIAKVVRLLRYYSRSIEMLESLLFTPRRGESPVQPANTGSSWGYDL